MKSVNSFEVTGFIVNDAKVNKFNNASVARFGLAIARTEGKDENKKRTSAILNVEIWRSNKNAADLDLLKKGNRITVKGFFKPEEYTKDEKTVSHIVFAGTEITTGDDEGETPDTTEAK
ncbi:MAG: single-stranded DNA-binding protein [Prevotella sp.]|nr:single-stranded DNA-binding protein [Prevotella sp.]